MNTFNTQLISIINNSNFLENKNVLIFKKTKFSLILCKCFYEEGLITSFEVKDNQIKIFLNSLLKKKKLLKYVFSKNFKNTLNLDDLSKLKSSFHSFILSGTFGLKSSSYYAKKKKGGVSVYKLL